MLGSSKARSGDVFGIINEMYKKRKLPRDLKPWRTYYLLQLDPTKYYPDEFDEDDARSAVKYAAEKGVTHDALVMFFGETVRRTGKKLFDLPLIIETSTGKETLQVPIYGARDFGSFREVVHVSYLLAHPNLPCDTKRSAFSVLSVPQVEMTLRYGMRKKNVTIDPFEVEKGDRRVATIAFGAGVKDNDTELLSWKVLPNEVDATHAVNEVRREALQASPDPTQPVQLINPLATPSESKAPIAPPSTYTATSGRSWKKYTTEEEDYSAKDATAYLILNFFLGMFGVHRLYLGKKSGIFYFFVFGLMGLLPIIDMLIFIGGFTRDKEKNILQISPGQKKAAIFCVCVYCVVGWFFAINMGSDHHKKEQQPVHSTPPSEQPASPAQKGV